MIALFLWVQSLRAGGNVNRWEVMIFALVGIDRRSCLAPRHSPVRGLCEVDIELAGTVILPGYEQVSVVPVDRDAWEIVGADVGAGYALFRAAAEITERLTSLDVGTDQSRRTAVEVCGSGGRVSTRLTADG